MIKSITICIFYLSLSYSLFNIRLHSKSILRSYFLEMMTSSTESGLIIPGDNNYDDSNELPEDAVGAAPTVLPKVSSKINFGELDINIKYDLWIVGSGTLGEFILKEWKQNYPRSNVIAETKTINRHDLIKSLDVIPRLRENRSEIDDYSAKNVIICLPPSSCEQYAEEVHTASRLWAGIKGGGNLVFTSSLGVYGESNGNTVTESFRIDTRSKTSTKLLTAEESILGREGNVIRLAGLYTEQRGPHTYWLKQAKDGKVIDGNSNGLVNMLHYEDAAKATIALTTSSGFQQKIFVACDNEVITRKEICNSAIASKLFPDSPIPEFSSFAGAIGKTCDCSVTRNLLNWKPIHTSFRIFMRRKGGEIINDIIKEDETKKTSTLWLPGGDDDDDF